VMAARREQQLRTKQRASGADKARRAARSQSIQKEAEATTIPGLRALTRVRLRGAQREREERRAERGAGRSGAETDPVCVVGARAGRVGGGDGSGFGERTGAVRGAARVCDPGPHAQPRKLHARAPARVSAIARGMEMCAQLRSQLSAPEGSFVRSCCSRRAARAGGCVCSAAPRALLQWLQWGFPERNGSTAGPLLC